MMTRYLYAAIAVLAMLTSGSQAAEIDRAAVDFVTPENIRWVKNPNGTNEQAILYGNPSQPGPYVARIKWYPGNMSRPHFHQNDRFFAVISGTWWTT